MINRLGIDVRSVLRPMRYWSFQHTDTQIIGCRRRPAQPPLRRKPHVRQTGHAAIRSSSHSSMKAEFWFQLRIVGVTTIREPGFGRASSIAQSSPARRMDHASEPRMNPERFLPQLSDVLRGEMSFGAQWLAVVARRGSGERVRATASGSIWRSRARRTASEASG